MKRAISSRHQSRQSNWKVARWSGPGSLASNLSNIQNVTDRLASRRLSSANYSNLAPFGEKQVFANGARHTRPNNNHRRLVLQRGFCTFFSCHCSFFVPSSCVPMFLCEFLYCTAKSGSWREVVEWSGHSTPHFLLCFLISFTSFCFNSFKHVINGDFSDFPRPL